MAMMNVIYELRTKMGLSQEALADKLFVSRQAVSRWETGETVPNTETLKLLSKFFGVSINTLLDSPFDGVCKCCGMPLEDVCDIAREKDGTINPQYCKWCYDDGEFTLDYWKQNRGKFTEEQFECYFEQYKEQTIKEFNVLLQNEGLPRVENLNVLTGWYINHEYTLPNGERVKFLDDKASYLGNQLKSESGRLYGIAANMDLLLISTYDENGENQQLILFKKRL